MWRKYQGPKYIKGKLFSENIPRVLEEKHMYPCGNFNMAFSTIVGTLRTKPIVTEQPLDVRKDRKELDELRVLSRRHKYIND